MASNNQEVLLALAHRNRLIAMTLLQVENNQRTHWVRKLWQSREELSFHFISFKNIYTHIPISHNINNIK